MPERAGDQRGESRSETWKLGNFQADMRRQVLRRDNEEIPLTGLTWRLLQALIEASPETLRYDALAELVWKRHFVSDDAIAQRVSQLRKALGDSARKPRYIRTFRGHGLQLLVPVEPSKLVVPREGAGVRNKLRRFAPLVAALVLAGGMVTWHFSKPGVTRADDQLVSDMLRRAHDYQAHGRVSSNDQAVRLYRNVLELRPDSLDGLTGLSTSLTQRPTKFQASLGWAEEAQRIAETAVELYPSEPRAWAARAFVDDAFGRVTKAVRGYRRAVDLGGQSERPLASLAYLHLVSGDLVGALQRDLQARRMAPPTDYSDLQIAQSLALAGLDETAAQWLGRVALLRPDIVFLPEVEALSNIRMGRWNEALRSLEGSVGSVRNSQRELQAQVLTKLGRQDDARSVLNEAREVAASTGNSCFVCEAFALRSGEAGEAEYQRLIKEFEADKSAGDEWPMCRVEMAYVHLAFDQRESALHSLRSAYRLGYRDWRWLRSSPLLASLRGDDGFESIIESMRVDTERQSLQIRRDPQLASLFELAAI